MSRELGNIKWGTPMNFSSLKTAKNNIVDVHPNPTPGKLYFQMEEKPIFLYLNFTVLLDN